MTIAMQVMYPITDETTFDMNYYLDTHMKLVGEHMGAHLTDAFVNKGLASGPDAPPAHYAVATLTFADQAAFDAAMGDAGPVLADIPNFTNTTPQMLIGEVVR